MQRRHLKVQSADLGLHPASPSSQVMPVWTWTLWLLHTPEIPVRLTWVIWICSNLANTNKRGSEFFPRIYMWIVFSAPFTPTHSDTPGTEPHLVRTCAHCSGDDASVRTLSDSLLVVFSFRTHVDVTDFLSNPRSLDSHPSPLPPSLPSFPSVFSGLHMALRCSSSILLWLQSRCVRRGSSPPVTHVCAHPASPLRSQ